MNKNKRWSKFFRWAGAGVFSLSILLGQVYPVHAKTPASVPSVSPWAVTTLNEGEKYGIFPLQWYQDEAFLQPISAERFAELMKATEKKLDALGLQKKAAAVSVPQEKVITRETVMTSLYKLLANYELPAAFEMTGQDSLAYLQKKGLVKGTGNAGLALQQPATVEQAVVLASRVVEFAYDTAGSGAAGLMWKVTNGKNTLYLLGSVHLGITDMYPMKKSIRDAFEASDDLWVEADIVGGDMDYMTEKMMYSDGTTLKDHVSAETYSKLQKVLASLGLPENAFDTLKPFAVTLSLPTFGYFSDPAEGEVGLITGIDRYFLTKALLADKPIHELEGIKLQADLLSGVPAEQQEKELNTMLDSILSGEQLADQGKILQDMQRDWVEGDLEGLTNTLTTYGQFGAGEVNQRLLGERDRNMASKLVQLLEQEGEHTSFVVIGSAHYAMKGMVLDQLKQKGYDIQRMK
ncbi:TraB/GumN family protein [Brevibacillus agri]